MIISDITRSTTFTTNLSAYEPFIYVGYTHNYQYQSSWGDSLGGVILKTGKREKVKQVQRDYIVLYEEMETYIDCKNQEMTFYFDRENQIIYIHVEHSYNPIQSKIDYGYAFGICSSSLGVTYIDDYEYLPLIKSSPSIEQESDIIGSSQPTGMTGSMSIINTSCKNESTGKIEGLLDWILDESIYGNIIDIYDYNENVKGIGSFLAENIEVSQSEVSIDLQDRRYS